ncbi:MAG: phosphoglucosamine mutase [Bacillota bacterium]
MLMKSISGIRGTIGGQRGENLTPVDVVKFVSAYALERRQAFPKPVELKVVLGRDGRSSGPLLHELVSSVLRFSGITVLDAGLATTPTVEMAVLQEKAQGGIILSASHNPAQWNALKLLNEKGEFLDAEAGAQVLELAEAVGMEFPGYEDLGQAVILEDPLGRHIEAVLALDSVLGEEIGTRGYKVVVDGINSVGGIAVPRLLEALGLKDISVINGEANGRFAHNPEPLDEHLGEIKDKVLASGADLGIVVDPDVDRLAFIDEQGKMFGEEYTLVAVGDYILSHYHPCYYQKIAVSNLSSSRALKDVAERHGGGYFSAAVGEVNVVAKMKETGAAIGGEGNGGIIYPDLHYGRDALVGIALFLSALAESGLKMSEYKERFPKYEMIKDRIDLAPGTDISGILRKIKEGITEGKIDETDGIKIDFDDSWLHLRASNTEPIIRIYAEGKEAAAAKEKIERVKELIK